MAKKKRNHKIKPFKQDNRIVYNTAKPNRQARRLGAVAVEPPKKEEPKRVSKAAVLREKLQQAQEIQKKIVPPDMTYGEYMHIAQTYGSIFVEFAGLKLYLRKYIIKSSKETEVAGYEERICI